MKYDNVLVTGGAGFIGSNLVKHLVAAGKQVTVFDNLMSGYRSNLEPYPEARFIQGDVRDPEAVKVAMRGIDVVFHFAASVGNKRSIDQPIMDAEINVLGDYLTALAAVPAPATNSAPDKPKMAMK